MFHFFLWKSSRIIFTIELTPTFLSFCTGWIYTHVCAMPYLCWLTSPTKICSSLYFTHFYRCFTVWGSTPYGISHTLSPSSGIAIPRVISLCNMNMKRQYASIVHYTRRFHRCAAQCTVSPKTFLPRSRLNRYGFAVIVHGVIVNWPFLLPLWLLCSLSQSDICGYFPKRAAYQFTGIWITYIGIRKSSKIFEVYTADPCCIYMIWHNDGMMYMPLLKFQYY